MDTIIKSSTELRKSYKTIADLCKSSQAPVFITNNGEGDTVIMDMKTFNRREENFEIAERLIEAKRSRAEGIPGVSLEDFEKNLRNAISTGANNRPVPKYKKT